MKEIFFIILFLQRKHGQGRQPAKGFIPALAVSSLMASVYKQQPESLLLAHPQSCCTQRG